jgi:hypothetical protein
MMNLFAWKPDETRYTGSYFRLRLATQQGPFSTPIVSGQGWKGGKPHISFSFNTPVTAERFPDNDAVTLRRCSVQLRDDDHCAALLLEHFYTWIMICSYFPLTILSTCPLSGSDRASTGGHARIIHSLVSLEHPHYHPIYFLVEVRQLYE